MPLPRQRAGDRVARAIRDRSGPLLASLARPLHTIGLHGLGHGAAVLDPDRSGERHVIALLREGASPTVMDVGAFKGHYATVARDVLGDAATIHCFEPNEACRKALRAQTETLGIRTHHLALGSATGRQTLHVDPDDPTLASLDPTAASLVGRSPSHRMEVAVDTLDAFCSREGIKRIDLLKLDVEGRELDVLLGARRLLDEGRIGHVQFEFGYANVATRTFLRDFYELLSEGRAFHRVAPRGLIALGEYRLELEIFVTATNYVAIATGSR